MVCGTGLSIFIPQFPLSVFFFAHTPSQVKRTHLLDFLETYGLYERYDRKTFPPIESLALGGFFRVPADGTFLQFLIFYIQDLSRLTNASRPDREHLRSKRSAIHFLWGPRASSPPPRPKNFSFFGCGWRYDREIALHNFPHK